MLYWSHNNRNLNEVEFSRRIDTNSRNDQKVCLNSNIHQKNYYFKCQQWVFKLLKLVNKSCMTMIWNYHFIPYILYTAEYILKCIVIIVFFNCKNQFWLKNFRLVVFFTYVDIIKVTF